MYVISVWLCITTAWLGDIPHQRIEVFRSEPVCIEFCSRSVEFHRERGLHDLQCTCERRTVYDRLGD